MRTTQEHTPSPENFLFPELAREYARFAVKVEAVLAQRSEIVSTLEDIRLGREEDAVFWMLRLPRRGGSRYRRRCFGSCGNLSLQPIEMGSELIRRPSRHSEYLYYHGLAVPRPHGTSPSAWIISATCGRPRSPGQHGGGSGDRLSRIATWNLHDLIRAPGATERRRGCFVSTS
jgi:hypothetical protein